MRILVTGATGLLGPYLVKALAPLGEVTTLAREGTGCYCGFEGLWAGEGRIGKCES